MTGAVTTTMSYNSQLLTLAYDVTQSNDGTSPLVGTDGRIGNTAYFTGEDDGHVRLMTTSSVEDWQTMSKTAIAERFVSSKLTHLDLSPLMQDAAE